MSEPHVIKAILLALAILFGVIVGGVTTLLRWLAGAHPGAAVINGGAAFAGTVGLAILMMSLF